MNIVLAAFGKRGYFFAAYNLAFSIKHYDPKANILLIHDKGIKAINDLNLFDELHEINEALTHPQGMFDAGNVKLHTYKIATKHFKEYLFLDVDTISLKSLQPFYDSVDKDFATDVKGVGGINDKINYSVWADNEDIWSEFKLPEDRQFRAIQSSWHYAKKCRANTALFNDAIKLNLSTFKNRKMLKIRWGKSLPDELVLGGALARKDIDPAFNSPMFFTDKHKKISEIMDEYYLMSFFGNGVGKTISKSDYKDFYDRYMIKMFREHGMNHHYKISYIMNDKMINK